MPASKEQRQHAVERAAKIFTILKQCAEQGLPCPSNRELADRFGVKSGTIANALHFLEANGMIEREQKSDRVIITICASGKTTEAAAQMKQKRFPSDTRKRRRK